MAHHISHKLSNALEGALAGGGDPATSPLYVFGPFLKLIVVAGVAQVTFGASVWMVVVTIMVVSAMYRLVMQWVTDGSGGSGLSEEEFGGWAVKINAAITFVEYTLTFLVSMSALVTFIADRFPILNITFIGIQYRVLLAVALSLLTGWLVNRGPKVAARTFGPATAGVLILLWVMVFSTIWKTGLHLPVIDLRAFHSSNLYYTVNGYARILAVMTGIEVFANLVAAYGGNAAQKSKKAFGSLMIVMGTAAVTMLIVGPAIYQFSDPTNEHVSVFTQTMDYLLPAPLPYLGTIIGVAVLMSASAASAQGLQNLALGLKERNYIPRFIGQQNAFEVAGRPVWIEIAIVCGCFVFFGTKEETYLAIYAAGVFVLLSMTGWAVTKRLLRKMRQQASLQYVALIAGTILAASLTSSATVLIFTERFTEGAWTYFIFIPLLFVAFTYFRNKLGAPTAAMDYLGHLDMTYLAGFGFGQYPLAKSDDILQGNGYSKGGTEITWKPAPIENSTWRNESTTIQSIVVLMDGSPNEAQALPMAKAICAANQAKLLLLSTLRVPPKLDDYPIAYRERADYLSELASLLMSEGIHTDTLICQGSVGEVVADQIKSIPVDMVVTTGFGRPDRSHQEQVEAFQQLVQKINKPVLLIQPRSQAQEVPHALDRILIALDGSIQSERSLVYARALAKSFGSEVTLMAVPAVPESQGYPVPAEFIQTLQSNANINMQRFLDAVARSLESEGIKTHTIVTGSSPADTIVSVSAEVKADLILLTSRGRGGLDSIFMGSVAEQVLQNTIKPVFLVPIPEKTYKEIYQASGTS